MKKTIITLFLILAVIMAGCKTEVNSNTKSCTEEAKACDDGSSVSRNPDKNCEFDDCPLGNKVDVQFRSYMSDNPEQCKAMLFRCDKESTKPFFDQTGCGCEAAEPKKYVSSDLEQCKVMKFACDKNYVAFADEIGCGCEFSWEEANKEETQNCCQSFNEANGQYDYYFSEESCSQKGVVCAGSCPIEVEKSFCQ